MTGKRMLTMAVTGVAVMALVACAAQDSPSLSQPTPFDTATTGTTAVQANPSPTRAMAIDYATFRSVKELAQESQLIVRGHVVGGPTQADSASHLGGDPGNNIPSVVYEVAVDEIYTGEAGPRIYVTQTDPSRIGMAQPPIPFTKGEKVVLFLSDPGVTFQGLSVHGSSGNDQGHVVLTGASDVPKPVSPTENVPLPRTLSALEKEIAAARA